MVSFSYVREGLQALSRAHRAGNMSGHLGGAVLAGYFFGEVCPNLPTGVYLGIERDLERIIRGEETIWFNQKEKGITIPELFSPAVGEGGRAVDGVERVGRALSQSLSDLRQSGHNAIFGSLILRALHQHPELAKESLVVGLEKLLAGFVGVGQGKAYFGKEAGWRQGAAIKISPEIQEAVSYETLSDMVVSTVQFLIDHAHEHRRGMGGVIHLIDHAAALLELTTAGLNDLALSGLAAHRRHRAILESLPILDSELGPLVAAELSPLTPDYWLQRDSAQWSAALTHRIKVCYGYQVLRQEVEDEELLRKADQAFRFLVG